MGFWTIIFGYYGGGEAATPAIMTGGVVQEFRSRTATTDQRSRVIQTEFRSRTAVLASKGNNQ